MEAYKILKKIIRTTRTGLPEHTLKFLQRGVEPLSKDVEGGLTYAILVKKNHELYPNDKNSSGTLWWYISELRKTAYVDVLRDVPEDKKKFSA